MTEQILTEPEALVPAEPGPVPAPAPAKPKKSRRPLLLGIARWTAAVLVCGGVGAGAAMGITAMERTDVPGLATEPDGRWEYPQLALPALPEGPSVRTPTATTARSTTPTCGSCCCPHRWAPRPTRS